MNCGKQRCSLSKEELICVEEKSPPDISVPRFGNLEALSLASRVIPHNYHDCSHRAATPLNNDGSAIPNAELAFSLIGTDTNIGATAPSEAPTWQGSRVSLGQWDADIGLAPAHLYEPCLGSLPSAEVTYKDSRSDLPSSSLGVSNFPTEINSPLDPSNVDPLQQTAGVERQLERRHVAVKDAAVTPGSAAQAAQTSSSLVLPDGTAPGSLSLGCTDFPSDTSISFPLDLHLPWVFSGDYVFVPQLPVSAPTSKRTITSPHRQRVATKDASNHKACCKPSGTQRLACPFYKYDPKRYIDCVLKNFDTVGHMKQHLKINHKLGPNHCKHCWLNFDTAASLAHHAQNCKLPTGGVPVDNMPVFPKIRGYTREQKWYWGWKKLFGERTAPPPCPFSHPLQDFQAPELSHHITGEESRGETASCIGAVEEDEYSNPATPHVLHFTNERDLLTVTGRIADILPVDLDLSSIYETGDGTPRGLLWDLRSENFD